MPTAPAMPMRLVITVDIAPGDVPYVRAMMAADYISVSTPNVEFHGCAVALTDIP